MSVEKYILNGKGEPVREDDLFKWGAFMDSRQQVVKQETVGTARISTVFLGLDHNFMEDGPPVLWETMVFGGKHNSLCERCAGSHEQALAMHDRVVSKVRDE